MPGVPAKRTPAVWVGAAALGGVPAAVAAGINRFALLPQILALLCVALSGLLVRSRDAAPNAIARRWVVPALGLVALTAASSVWAVNKFAVLLPTATQLGYSALFLTLAGTLRVADLPEAMRIGVIAGAVLAAFGLCQFLGFTDQLVPSAGLPSATLGHRNIAGAYVVVLLPLSFYLFWTAPDRRERSVFAATTAILLAFLFATRSRAAWVGLLGAFAWGGVLAWRTGRLADLTSRGRRAGCMIIVCCGLGFAALPAKIGKGVGEAMWHGKASAVDAMGTILAPGGDKGRLVLWRRTLEMIRNRPIIGVGAGNWRIVYPDYADGDLVDLRSMPFRPHNDPLWVLSELGLLGILLYITLHGAGLAASARAGAASGLAVACGASLSAGLITAFFGFSREFPGAWAPVYTILAMLATLSAPGVARARYWTRPLLAGGIALLAAAIGTIGVTLAFDVHALNARVASASQDWPAVQQEADAALSLGPLDEDVFLLRARAANALGDPGDARRFCREGLRHSPNSPALWMESGNAARNEGRLADAQEDYQRAMALAPGSAELHNNLGTLYGMAGHLDAAGRSFRKALQLPNAPVEAFANLSVVLRRSGDVSGAVDVARAGLDRDADDVSLLNAMGSALAAGPEPELARPIFEKALGLDDTQAEVHYNLGRLCETLADTARALEAFERTLELLGGAKASREAEVRSRIDRLRSQGIH